MILLKQWVSTVQALNHKHLRLRGPLSETSVRELVTMCVSGNVIEAKIQEIGLNNMFASNFIDEFILCSQIQGYEVPLQVLQNTKQQFSKPRVRVYQLLQQVSAQQAAAAEAIAKAAQHGRTPPKRLLQLPQFGRCTNAWDIQSPLFSFVVRNEQALREKPRLLAVCLRLLEDHFITKKEVAAMLGADHWRASTAKRILSLFNDVESLSTSSLDTSPVVQEPKAPLVHIKQIKGYQGHVIVLARNNVVEQEQYEEWVSDRLSEQQKECNADLTSLGANTKGNSSSRKQDAEYIDDISRRFNINTAFVRSALRMCDRHELSFDVLQQYLRHPMVLYLIVALQRSRLEPGNPNYEYLLCFLHNINQNFENQWVYTECVKIFALHVLHTMGRGKFQQVFHGTRPKRANGHVIVEPERLMFSFPNYSTLQKIDIKMIPRQGMQPSLVKMHHEVCQMLGLVNLHIVQDDGVDTSAGIQFSPLMDQAHGLTGQTIALTKGNKPYLKEIIEKLDAKEDISKKATSTMLIQASGDAQMLCGYSTGVSEAKMVKQNMEQVLAYAEKIGLKVCLAVVDGGNRQHMLEVRSKYGILLAVCASHLSKSIRGQPQKRPLALLVKQDDIIEGKIFSSEIDSTDLAELNSNYLRLKITQYSRDSELCVFIDSEIVFVFVGSEAGTAPSMQTAPIAEGYIGHSFKNNIASYSLYIPGKKFFSSLKIAAKGDLEGTVTLGTMQEASFDQLKSMYQSDIRVQQIIGWTNIYVTDKQSEEQVVRVSDKKIINQLRVLYPQYQALYIVLDDILGQIIHPILDKKGTHDDLVNLVQSSTSVKKLVEKMRDDIADFRVSMGVNLALSDEAVESIQLNAHSYAMILSIVNKIRAEKDPTFVFNIQLFTTNRLEGVWGEFRQMLRVFGCYNFALLFSHYLKRLLDRALDKKGYSPPMSSKARYKPQGSLEEQVKPVHNEQARSYLASILNALQQMTPAAWLLATEEELEDIVGNLDKLLQYEMEELTNEGKAYVEQLKVIARQLKVKCLHLRAAYFLPRFNSIEKKMQLIHKGVPEVFASHVINVPEPPTRRPVVSVTPLEQNVSELVQHGLESIQEKRSQDVEAIFSAWHTRLNVLEATIYVPLPIDDDMEDEATVTLDSTEQQESEVILFWDTEFLVGHNVFQMTFWAPFRGKRFSTYINRSKEELSLITQHLMKKMGWDLEQLVYLCSLAPAPTMAVQQLAEFFESLQATKIFLVAHNSVRADEHGIKNLFEEVGATLPKELVFTDSLLVSYAEQKKRIQQESGSSASVASVAAQIPSNELKKKPRLIGSLSAHHKNLSEECSEIKKLKATGKHHDAQHDTVMLFEIVFGLVAAAGLPNRTEQEFCASWSSLWFDLPKRTSSKRKRQQDQEAPTSEETEPTEPSSPKKKRRLISLQEFDISTSDLDLLWSLRIPDLKTLIESLDEGNNLTKTGNKPQVVATAEWAIKIARGTLEAQYPIEQENHEASGASEVPVASAVPDVLAEEPRRSSHLALAADADSDNEDDFDFDNDEDSFSEEFLDDSDDDFDDEAAANDAEDDDFDI